GVDQLEVALDSTRALQERLGTLEPTILARRFAPPALSLVLLERHRRALPPALEAAQGAVDRLTVLLDTLRARDLVAAPGGAAPLGAVLAGLDLAGVSALAGPEGAALHEQARRLLTGA